MGICGSVDYHAQIHPWKQLIDPIESKRKYVQQNILDESSNMSHVELVNILEDTIAFKHITNFANSNKTGALLERWLELMKHEKAAVSAAAISNLKNICAKCHNCATNMDSQSKFAEFADELEQFEEELLTYTPDERALLLKNIFHDIRKTVYQEIYDDIFVKFKSNDCYAAMIRDIRDTYNKVDMDDFAYISDIGCGTFGIVLHCKRIATNAEYAMKVQSKGQILKNCKGNYSNASIEMRAVSACRNPYLPSLSYAFQTPLFVIMVMKYCKYGDLQRAIDNCERFSYERVKFYTAEIVSALIYLHTNSLIFRDLKPANILLNDDGHITLSDFGTISDATGKLQESVDYSDSERKQMSFEKLPFLSSKLAITQTQESIDVGDKGSVMEGEEGFINVNAQGSKDMDTLMELNKKTRAKTLVGKYL